MFQCSAELLLDLGVSLNHIRLEAFLVVAGHLLHLLVVLLNICLRSSHCPAQG